MIKLNTPRDELISWFQTEFKDLVQSMKDCSHHYDPDNLNPYHLEGDIFTHTMMVCKQAENFSDDNNYVKFTTLLHDIGKPKSVEIIKERKRKRFIGHEGASAFMVPDILNKTDLSVEDKIHIFKIVALHGNLFHHIKVDKTIKSDTVDVFKGMKSVLSDLTHQVRADSSGRFYKDRDLSDALFASELPEKFEKIINQLEDGVTESDLSAPTLTVLVGPPCSRKSQSIKDLIDEKTAVISRDDLVVAAGKKRGMNYSETFNFLRDNPDIEKSEVAEIFEKNYREARKNKKSVVVDMTSMSKKSRRKWINEFKGYNAKCKVFISGYDALVECNKKRGDETGKYISERVVLDMCKRFSLPMYSEGFTDIEYIWND